MTSRWSKTDRGALGGFQIGYDWQFNQAWLAGGEADFDLSSISGNGTSNFFSPPVGGLGNTLQQATDERVKWFGTVRARIGYLVSNSLLIYGTGGFAYGRATESARYFNPGPFGGFIGGLGSCPAGSLCYAGSSARVSTGWTAGGGFELPVMNHWTVKAEYLYVSLGGNNFTESNLPSVSVPAPTASITAHFSDTNFHVVRGGLNYRF